MSFRKYLVILWMVVFGASGDALLARGVKQTGAIDIHHILNVSRRYPIHTYCHLHVELHDSAVSSSRSVRLCGVVYELLETAHPVARYELSAPQGR